jgi:GTP-binding protein Era
MRYGTIAIVGRTNVGKSTFLNSALGQPLAIVSRLPQTTREALLGVVHSEDAQLAFIDTPGLHRPFNELGRRMNHEATESLRAADAALFVTDVFQISAFAKEAKRVLAAQGAADAVAERAARIAEDGEAPPVRWGKSERTDAELLALFPPTLPTVFVVNKIDKMRDKSSLLPYLEAMNKAYSFAATVPISARAGDGVDRVLAEVAKLLPEGPARFAADEVTDRPIAFFAREYIREQVLAMASREVPHATAVTLDAIEERSTGFHVSATIHVEKVGQRSILVGHGGEKIRDIGIAARQRLAELTEQPVHLKLFVRVTERWRDVPRQLAELGYTSSITPDS